MNPYDSDSDLEDAENGTSTDVLLGYTTETPSDDTFNQLGGEPVRLQLLITAAYHPDTIHAVMARSHPAPLTNPRTMQSMQ